MPARGTLWCPDRVAVSGDNRCLEYDSAMDTREALDALVGKHGLVKIAGNGEIGFTCLAVDPPEEYPRETDLVAFNDVVSLCWFRVRLDPGSLIDGHQIHRISGQHISRLD
jgi:hypothetical protein